MDNNKMQNLYEVRKTVRFGLTHPQKKRGIKTHLELNNLITKSFENIEKEINSKDKQNYKEKDLIDKVSQFIAGLEFQLGNWKNIYERYDLISVNKDYYKILARKAKFNAFKKDKNGVKQPQANQIKLSSLRNNKVYILKYWGSIISRNDYLLHIFKHKLEQYKNAVENFNTLSHTKPDLTDFRKIFLQILKVGEDWLKPIFDQSIKIEVGKKEDNNEIKEIKEFSGDENNSEINNLLDLGKEIREYFEANGSQVPYAKVSLNYYTAVQKPNNFDAEIKDGIKDLGIIEFFNKNGDEIKKFLEKNSTDKIDLLNNSKHSYSIELIQLFKPKTIPFSVKYNLAKYLEENYKNELNLPYKDKDILKKFDLLGQSVDIGKDYLECKDTTTFSLEKYPIKSAFDYSWENLARSLKREINFPKKACEKYLKDNFDLDIENIDFKLYANLLFIAENLATIEYGNPNNEKKNIESIKTTFHDIEFPFNKKDYELYRDNIISLLNQEKNKRNYKNILEAKQKLGLLRGGLKNKITKYYQLTQKFKDIASFIGKTLASIRDGLKEENELNKITDYGIIIEDKNQDKYFLTLKLGGKDIREKIKDKLGNGEYKVYEINSFISKALNKFIKNPLGEDAQKFHGDYKYKHKEVSIYKDEKWTGYKEYFLKHLKNSLLKSQIAKEQNWNNFGWNFDNCDTYEKFEKEVDKKGYNLIYNTISEENLETLISQEDCLLFPLINQDISSKKEKNINEFTKNFEKSFLGNGYRIHPEFSIFYRQPEEGNKKLNQSGIINRFGRLQLLANIGVEYIPQNNNFITKKEQNKNSIDQTQQNKIVQEFNNNKVNPYFESLNDYYIFGVDRGIKQLATLCITNKKGIIQNYDIYTKQFNNTNKKWEYTQNRTEGILDLTNLKVESDIDGNKFLVDISKSKVFKRDINGDKIKDGNGNDVFIENKQNIKLKELAYIRKLQYQMSSNEEGVLNFVNKYNSKEERQNNIKDLITPYKEGKYFEDLPIDIFEEMFESYKILKTNQNLSEIEKQNLMKLTTELDASEDLKKGIVANMIGVIIFLMQTYDYKVKIAIEDLSNAWYFSKDGLNGDILLNSKIDGEMDLKKQDNLALAGVGTYHFFEMQLFKKLFKISIEEGILHLVPSFGSVRNYTDIIKSGGKTVKGEYENKKIQFGVVNFVSPMNTSKKCPVCGEKKNIDRNYKKENIVYCKECKFISIWEINQRENINTDSKFNYSQEEIEKIIEVNNEKIRKKSKGGLNLNFIKNGDDNGAYNIGCKIK